MADPAVTLFAHPWRRVISVSDLLFDANFAALALSDGSNSAALTTSVTNMGFTFARASAATVQTSASAVVTSGIAANQVRIGDAGSGPGLVVEPERTNIIADSRDMTTATWTAADGTITANYAAGPDGSNVAQRTQLTAINQVSRYKGTSTQINYTTGQPYTASLWVRRTTADETTSSYIHPQGTEIGTTVTATSTWKRTQMVTASAGSNGTHQYVPNVTFDKSAIGGAGSASSRDYVVDLHQVELGKYATEAIITTTGSVTRNADRLYHTNDSVFQATNGTYNYVGFEIKFVAKSARADLEGANVSLFANNGASGAAIGATINVSTGMLSVQVGTVSQISNVAITWAKDDVVEIWIETGANTTTVAKYRVNGGAVTNLTSASPQTQSPALAGNTLDFFGPAGGGTTSGIVACRAQRISAYKYNKRPSWAA